MLYLGWAHDVLVEAQSCGDPYEVALMGQGHLCLWASIKWLRHGDFPQPAKTVDRVLSVQMYKIIELNSDSRLGISMGITMKF